MGLIFIFFCETQSLCRRLSKSPMKICIVTICDGRLPQYKTSSLSVTLNNQMSVFVNICTAHYCNISTALITLFLTLFLKFWGFFWSKVEVIFSILEVNFEILVEVICPASKSQDWYYMHLGKISVVNVRLEQFMLYHFGFLKYSVNWTNYKVLEV